MNSKRAFPSMTLGTATVFLALGGALGVAATPSRAQETGSITGLVLSQDELAPIPGALVGLPGTPYRTRADEDGRFRLLDVPAGAPLMRIEGEGFVTFIENVEIAPGEESLIHFRLHRLSTVLDQLLVAVAGADEPARGHSEGRVGGSGNIDRTAADLIMRSLPGVNAASPQGAAGSGVRIRLRGVSSFVLSEEPQIYLDGVRIDAGGQDRAMLTLADIPASSVARIRVLRGPASTSLYPTAASGVILVETLGPGG